MNKKQFPYDWNQDLTNERLTLIAQLIANTRHAALDEHDPDKGDGAWSYGCRCYQRCMHEITEKQKEWPWLRVVPTNTPLEFEFKIGEVSLRFYKDKSTKMCSQTLASRFPELKQLELQISGGEDASLFWVLVIETAHDGEVLAIRCVGMTTAQEIMCDWEIPLKPYIPVITSSKAALKEPVEQDKPTVTIHTPISITVKDGST